LHVKEGGGRMDRGDNSHNSHKSQDQLDLLVSKGLIHSKKQIEAALIVGACAVLFVLVCLVSALTGGAF